MTAKPITPVMYYVVSRALAEAMRTGRPCKRGTVHGVFADVFDALAFQFERKLTLSTEVVEQ